MGLAEGKHEVEIRSHFLSTSSKGTPCVEIDFADDAGNTITAYRYLSPAALKYALRDLANCGWDGAACGWAVSELNGTDVLVGNRVRIVVEEDLYDGKVRAKVASIYPLRTTLGGEMAQELDAQIRAMVRDLPPEDVPGGAATPVKREEPGPKKDPTDEDFNFDDIPF